MQLFLITSFYFLYFLIKKVGKQLAGASPSIISQIRSAAKQARDEESLMRIMKKDFIVKSLSPNGDCGYELMCKWKKIHQIRSFGRRIPTRVIEERVSPQQIVSMRDAIAGMQEKLILQGDATLQTLIMQSLIDWSRNPTENNGRNAEVAAALQSLPEGVQEEEWLNSRDALALHSSLIRTGRHEVFAESPEMEAFSLMVQCPVAIYLPGYCEVYPQSSPYTANEDMLVGICNGNHYYLAVPKLWIGQGMQWTNCAL